MLISPVFTSVLPFPSFKTHIEYILKIYKNLRILKGSYDDATVPFPHNVHYCDSSLPRLSETCRFLKSSSFSKAQCALIGQLSSALWLAEYLKHVMEMLRPLPYLETVSPWQQYYNENKLRLLALCIHLGGVMQIFPHSDVDLWGSD